MMLLPDVSFYQYRFDARWSIEKYIDFETMRTKTEGVIIRAGQNLWEDRCFSVSWQRAKEAGLLRGSYWFYDSRANPKRQAEKYADVLGNDAGEMELWMDFEDRYNGDYHGMKHWYDFAERLRNLLPEKKLGVYTGYYYWRENIIPAHTYFGQYPLWIAAYNPEAPMIPPTWNDWLMWQFTDNGDGATWGAASGNIDLNQFKGDFRARYGLGNSPDRLTANFGQRQVIYQEQK